MTMTLNIRDENAKFRATCVQFQLARTSRWQYELLGIQGARCPAKESIMLSLRIQKLQDVTILHCAGRFAFPHAAKLGTAILREVRASVLVLDMMETVAIDAAGLGVLVSLRTWANSTGRILKLMNVTPWVEQLLRLTRLNSEFEICSAREMVDLLCLAIRTHESGRSGPPGQDISNVEGTGHHARIHVEPIRADRV